MSGLPNAARAEIPMCGHYPQYSHPALTAELTRQFLTAPSCMSDCEPKVSAGTSPADAVGSLNSRQLLHSGSGWPRVSGMHIARPTPIR